MVYVGGAFSPMATVKLGLLWVLYASGVHVVALTSYVLVSVLVAAMAMLYDAADVYAATTSEYLALM